MTDDTIRSFTARVDIDDELKASILVEQNRRQRELVKLLKAIDEELDSIRKRDHNVT